MADKKTGSNAPELKKQLNPANVWAIAFGCIIGWGSFINPGKKFLPNSGVAGTAIAMVLGGLVMVIIAFSYAYMIPKYPKAGGEFTFTKHCFGKRSAYLCGWFLVAAYLTNVPMNSTAIGLIVDGIDGSADILKFGFNYQMAGFAFDRPKPAKSIFWANFAAFFAVMSLSDHHYFAVYLIFLGSGLMLMLQALLIGTNIRPFGEQNQ